MKLTGFIAALVLLGAVALADHFTQYELGLRTYYLMPVAIAAWFSGRWPGFGLAAIAGFVWVYVDYHTGSHYTSESYRFWKIGMIFLRFGIGALLLSQLRHSLDLAKQLARDKEAALIELKEATAKLRELEGSLQTVCSWTKKIKDGDECITLEEYLRRYLKIEVTHGIFPEGRTKFWNPTAAGQSRPPVPE